MSTDKPEASIQPEPAAPSVIRRRKSRRNRVLAVVLLLAAGGGYYWYQDDDQGPATQPLIATVEVGTIENTIAASGSLQPYEFVDVGAQVSGQLQKLYVEVGDLVEQGQLLAEIDARVQQNRVDASRASIESLQAQMEARRASLQLAQANADRQKRLMEADATSQLDYDSAMNNLVSAQSNVIQMEKQIEQSLSSLATEETQLDFTRIYAPIAGTVVTIEMNEGRTLNANQSAPTILRIADLSVMTVETAISEADIGNIKKGMSVYFTTLGSGSRRWYADLRQILPTPVIENNVVLYTGLFDAENPDGILLPEMTAQVFFVTSSAEDVLTVPVGALTFKDAPGDEMASRARRVAGQFPPGGAAGSFAQGERSGSMPRSPVNNSGRRLASVQVVNEDGGFTEREVIVGVTSRIAAEVVSGLERGERVVAGILQLDIESEEDDDRGGNINIRGFR